DGLSDEDAVGGDGHAGPADAGGVSVGQPAPEEDAGDAPQDEHGADVDGRGGLVHVKAALVELGESGGLGRHAEEKRRDADQGVAHGGDGQDRAQVGEDRKSTRLNSSHVKMSYGGFCLKKKKDI